MIRRVWAMPNKWTFLIPPIRELVERYVGDGIGWIDPFCGQSRLAQYRNDLDKTAHCDSHLLAEDYCMQFANFPDLEFFRGCILDPPYSGRQVKEHYTAAGRIVERDDCNGHFIAKVKRILAPKIEVGGYAICCGWNSNGMGYQYGFRMIELLIVPHGGSHNDTIITVEERTNEQLMLFEQEMLF